MKGLTIADFDSQAEAFKVVDRLVRGAEQQFGHDHCQELHDEFRVLDKFWFVHNTATKRTIEEEGSKTLSREADVKKAKWTAIEGGDDDLALPASSSNASDVKSEQNADYVQMVHATADLKSNL